MILDPFNNKYSRMGEVWVAGLGSFVDVVDRVFCIEICNSRHAFIFRKFVTSDTPLNSVFYSASCCFVFNKIKLLRDKNVFLVNTFRSTFIPKKGPNFAGWGLEKKILESESV